MSSCLIRRRARSPSSSRNIPDAALLELRRHLERAGVQRIDLRVGTRPLSRSIMKETFALVREGIRPPRSMRVRS